MITIITPTYNAKEYINAQCIRLGPLLKEHNIKWIIIDDASTDNTDILIEKINDSNIIYHKLITNSGPSAARYIGAMLAETEFIFFLDADDILYNNDFIDFMSILEKN
ncbi:glycosyltransferase family 2 protein [Morganella morganii]|nr:glycosyltransferase family A protein [Morganella morganii]QXO42719.1 glycosyltransferase family 2 protein [Morganella morganii]